MQKTTHPSDITSIVFDYGAVIVNLNIDKVREALAALGISRWKQWWHRRQFRRIMHDFTNGLQPEEEILSELLPYCRPGTTYHQLLQAVSLVCEPLSPQRLEVLVALRKHYRVYLLSNINATLWENAVKEMNAIGYTVEDCFDQIFLSYQLQCAKPDPHIYRNLIAATGLIPSQTLYFDDSKENIHAGHRAHLISVTVPFNQLETNKIYQSLCHYISG